MKKIWKYALDADNLQTVKMPVGAKILTAQTQMVEGLRRPQRRVQLWVLVDVGDGGLVEYEDRVIAIYPTGEPLPDEPGEYVSTFQIDNGSLVFHVFDVTKTAF